MTCRLAKASTSAATGAVPRTPYSGTGKWMSSNMPRPDSRCSSWIAETDRECSSRTTETLSSVRTRSAIRTRPVRSRAIPVALAALRQIHTIQNWFNPCAFEQAPAGRTRYRCIAAAALRSSFREYGLLDHQGFPACRSAKAWACSSGRSSSTCSTIREFYMGGSGGSGQQDINAPGPHSASSTTR